LLLKRVRIYKYIFLLLSRSCTR